MKPESSPRAESSPRRRVHGEGGDTVTQEPPSLFEPDSVGRPLADLLRPETLEDVLGLEHLLGHDAPIGRMVDERRLVSMVLWGPPGCGKTNIERLLADRTGLAFEPLTESLSRVADIRRVIQSAG